jgi:hypothetical protein
LLLASLPFDSAQLSEKLIQQLLKTLFLDWQQSLPQVDQHSFQLVQGLHCSSCGRDPNFHRASSVASRAWSCQPFWHRNSSDFNHRTSGLSSLVARTRVSLNGQKPRLSKNLRAKSSSSTIFLTTDHLKKVNFDFFSWLHPRHFSVWAFSTASESVSSSGVTSSQPSDSSPWKKKISQFAKKNYFDMSTLRML